MQQYYEKNKIENLVNNDGAGSLADLLPYVPKSFAVNQNTQYINDKPVLYNQENSLLVYMASEQQEKKKQEEEKPLSQDNDKSKAYVPPFLRKKKDGKEKKKIVRSLAQARGTSGQ